MRCSATEDRSVTRQAMRGTELARSDAIRLMGAAGRGFPTASLVGFASQGETSQATSGDPAATRTFPKRFFWGTVTAAYPIEGAVLPTARFTTLLAAHSRLPDAASARHRRGRAGARLLPVEHLGRLRMGCRVHEPLRPGVRGLPNPQADAEVERVVLPRGDRSKNGGVIKH